MHGPTVPCLLLFLPVTAWHWVLQGPGCRRKDRLYWFLSIIKTNVAMIMVPLSTANLSEWMHWWPWKGCAVSEEKSLLLFSAWKFVLQIYGIHAKICARLCWLWAVGISAFSPCCYCCIRLQKLDAGCIGVEDWDLWWFTLTERRNMGMPTKKTQTLNKQKHAQTNNFPPPPPTAQIVVGGLQMKAWQGKNYHCGFMKECNGKPGGFERTLGLAPSY